MKNQEIKKIISKLPDAPGVYIFRDRPKQNQGLGKPLYIGKATSLRDRVRSYFNHTQTTQYTQGYPVYTVYMSKTVFDNRSPLITKMLSRFDSIDHIKTDSVLEALVLEAHLIKKYQPEANIKEKDNRSFNFVVITKEDFPKVLILRGRELLKSQFSKEFPFKILKSFGPFPNGSQLREVMKIVRKMFPYRDNCTPCIFLRNSASSLRLSVGCKPCFNRQIGLCPGVCTGEITQKQYAEQIKNIILFFQGNKKRLIKNMKKQMKDFAKTHQFEKANQTKKTLFALSHIQDISLIKYDVPRACLATLPRHALGSGFRIESYDVAHLSGTNVVGVMTVLEDGEVKRSDYRKFKIKDPAINDTKTLAEILSRRLGHIEWPMPELIVVDGGIAQKRVMEKVLREDKQNIPVVSVVKDEYHRPREILGDKKWLKFEQEILLSNAEAHRFAIGFHKQLREKLK